MLIILDTNVIQASNPTLTTAGVDALVDYAARTESEIILPQIVLQELEWNYRRALSEKVAGIRSAIKNLQRVARSTPPGNFEFDIEEEVQLYMATVRGRLKASRADPFGYKLEHLHDAIARAVSRRRPCSTRGEEIRDAIMWAGILDVLREGADVAFISANTREFGPDGKLHLELQAEVDPLPGLLHYLNSLEEFAKEHASPIQFITNEWIEQQLPREDVLHGATDQIVEVARRIILGNSDVTHAWDFEISSGHLEVDHVSVYVMRNGEYRVFVNWAGSVELSYVVADSSYDYGFDYTVGSYRYAPVSHLADYERQFRRLDLWADVETTATVKDGRVANWQIEQVFVTQRYI